MENPHDLIVVGAGPAGLSAAIFGASEGLDTLCVEHRSTPDGVLHTGGQSAVSSRIENYYGFPDGISGAELAERGRRQALRLGVKFLPADVARLTVDRTVLLTNEHAVSGRAVVIASGLSFRHLAVPGGDCPAVHYGQAVDEHLSGKSVAVIGGGNSAGQAAERLAELGCDVHLVVAGESLAATMSAYLLNRVTANPRIHLHYHAHVKCFNRDASGALTTVECLPDGIELPCVTAYVFIGMYPDTAWCSANVRTDPLGFIAINDRYETSLPGVFAVGDCHEKARNRVAAAVGEGSIALSYVHEWLGREADAAARIRDALANHEAAIRAKLAAPAAPLTP